jgi:hypothetical protein
MKIGVAPVVAWARPFSWQIQTRASQALRQAIAVALSGEVLEVHHIGSAATYENETVGHPDTMGLLSSWRPAT